MILLACVWLAVVAASWAESAEVPHDDYSFKWLDPDKKIYVLQNRKFVKAERPMVSVMVGPGISNSYRDTTGVGFRGAYFFSEDWGLEGQYTAGINSENQTYAALQISSPNASPVVREMRSQLGLNVMWVPWYAKINVFNRILYFDWYFTGGAGQIRTALDTRARTTDAASYQEKSFAALYLGTGQLFHVSQLFTVRLDMTTAFYRTPSLGTTGAVNWYSNTLFGFGLGLKL